MLGGGAAWKPEKYRCLRAAQQARLVPRHGALTSSTPRVSVPAPQASRTAFLHARALHIYVCSPLAVFVGERHEGATVLDLARSSLPGSEPDDWR